MSDDIHGAEGDVWEEGHKDSDEFVTAYYINTLRTGSFKLFKCPFLGFLIILTL
jgi:hypothetical protein